MATASQERLFIFHMPGCHTCAQMRPVLRAFRDKHPEVKVIPIDITSVEWRAEKWIPQVTPTLVRLDLFNRYTVYDGQPQVDGSRLITKEDMEQWLSRNFP